MGKEGSTALPANRDKHWSQKHHLLCYFESKITMMFCHRYPLCYLFLEQKQSFPSVLHKLHAVSKPRPRSQPPQSRTIFAPEELHQVPGLGLYPTFHSFIPHSQFPESRNSKTSLIFPDETIWNQDSFSHQESIGCHVNIHVMLILACKLCLPTSPVGIVSLQMLCHHCRSAESFPQPTARPVFYYLGIDGLLHWAARGLETFLRSPLERAAGFLFSFSSALMDTRLVETSLTTPVSNTELYPPSTKIHQCPM